MGIELAYNMIGDAFLSWIPFGMTWALSLVLTMLTLAILCGLDTAKWRENALPVLVAWNLCGVPTHALVYIILSIIYVNEHISISQLGEIASLATRRIQESINKDYWKPREGSSNKAQRDLLMKNEIDYRNKKLVGNLEQSRKTDYELWKEAIKRKAEHHKIKQEERKLSLSENDILYTRPKLSPQAQSILNTRTLKQKRRRLEKEMKQ